MQLNITKDIDKKLAEISFLYGFKKKEIAERALLFYIDAIQNYIKLKREFKEWDQLSDEALVDFEHKL